MAGNIISSLYKKLRQRKIEYLIQEHIAYLFYCLEFYFWFSTISYTQPVDEKIKQIKNRSIKVLGPIIALAKLYRNGN